MLINGARIKINIGLVRLSRFAFETVVYCTPRKKRITAPVLNIARYVIYLIFPGRIDFFQIITYIALVMNPTRKRKKVISIAGISEWVWTSFAKTVDRAKSRLDRRTRITPGVIAYL